MTTRTRDRIHRSARPTTAWVLAAVLVCGLGCQMQQSGVSQQTDHLLRSSYTVLRRHFRVVSISREDKQIIAESVVLDRFRTRVVASVATGGQGAAEVRVEVTNEVVSHLAWPAGGPGLGGWAVVAHDHEVARMLAEEIGSAAATVGPRSARGRSGLGGILRDRGRSQDELDRAMAGGEPAPETRGAGGALPALVRDGTHLAFMLDRKAFGDELTRHVALGDILFRKGAYGDAVREYEQAVICDPQAPVAIFALSHALFAIERYDAAAAAIEEGVKRDPRWVESPMHRPAFYATPAQFRGHLRALEAWTKASPEDVGALLVLGYNYYFSDQRADARVTLRRVLRMDPRSGAARALLGHLVYRESI